MQKATGETPAALITPRPPPALRYLLGWFEELSKTRQEGLNGPLPITWCDMQGWAAVTDTPLQPGEARALHQLDLLWRAAWSAGRPKPAKKARAKR